MTALMTLTAICPDTGRRVTIKQWHGASVRQVEDALALCRRWGYTRPRVSRSGQPLPF